MQCEAATELRLYDTTKPTRDIHFSENRRVMGVNGASKAGFRRGEGKPNIESKVPGGRQVKYP